MSILQAFFGSAQAELGYQFYGADGSLLGVRVTSGIGSLPEAGGYFVSVEVPEAAAGVYWSSDSNEASEAFTSGGGSVGAGGSDGSVGGSGGGAVAVVGAVGSDGFLDAGFGTLNQLKGFVLPQIMTESYDEGGEWDEDLRVIGKLVAGAFNRFCNRVFERGVNVSFDRWAGMETIHLERYPVESVSGMSLLTGDGTQDVLDCVRLVAGRSGMVRLDGYLGCDRDRVTVRYTGGYRLGSDEGMVRCDEVAVLPGQTEVRLALPGDFRGDQLAQVSLKRLSGDGALRVVDWSVEGVEVVVRLDGAAEAGAFVVSLLYLALPETGNFGGGSRGVTGEVVRALVPGSVAEFSVDLPDGFLGEDVAQVSLRRVGGAGSIALAGWSVAGGTVRVVFDGAALEDDEWEVVVLLLRKADAAGGVVVPLAGGGVICDSRSMVLPGVLEFTAVVPDGFLEGDVLQVSLRRVEGSGQVELLDWSVENGLVTGRLSGPALAGELEVSVLAYRASGGASGATGTALPAEIYGAWLLQCQAVVEHANTIWGAGVQRSGERVGRLGELELIPAVREVLNSYKRVR